MSVHVSKRMPYTQDLEGKVGSKQTEMLARIEDAHARTTDDQVTNGAGGRSTIYDLIVTAYMSIHMAMRMSTLMPTHR